MTEKDIFPSGQNGCIQRNALAIGMHSFGVMKIWKDFILKVHKIIAFDINLGIPNAIKLQIIVIQHNRITALPFKAF